MPSSLRPAMRLWGGRLSWNLWNPWVWQDPGDPQNQISSWVSVNLRHHKTNCWVCPSLFWFFIGSVLPVFFAGPNGSATARPPANYNPIRKSVLSSATPTSLGTGWRRYLSIQVMGDIWDLWMRLSHNREQLRLHWGGGFPLVTQTSKAGD